MYLPTEKSKPTRVNPKSLIIYSKPKIGKTTAVSMLPDTLILDLEDGSGYLESLRMRIIGIKPIKKETKEAKEKRMSEDKEFYLSEFVVMMKKNIRANKGKKPYKRIAIDTATKLEEWAEELATEKYMDTPQGVKFNRDNTGVKLPRDKWLSVLTLPRGLGYKFLRTTFKELILTIGELSEDLIILCHVKESNITKNGEELNVKEIDLTGKISRITASASDAIAYMYRDENKTVLNFETEEDVIGARCPHLRNKQIELVELTEEGEFISHWDRVYLPEGE